MNPEKLIEYWPFALGVVVALVFSPLLRETKVSRETRERLESNSRVGKWLDF